MLEFEILKTDPLSAARTGKIQTAHGEIQTPIFMPVGTLGTVKAVHQHELKEDIGAEIILGNTYHLYLRPGTDILEQAGGLHKFNGWDRPILTDSGGYQVYSLSHRRKIKEEGVVFQSHIDGSRHFFSPEIVMDIQRTIGADIIMAFDEGDARYGYWQTLFPIVQGSTYPDLRKASAEYIASKGARGNAIGGLSVGEPAEEMYKYTDLVCNILPKDKPRYLMGVGTPANILECIALGIDMFDCVLPTRNARHGLLYTSEGIINIKNAKWKDDFSVIDANCSCRTSRFYTKAYLRHLFHSKEFLAMQVASIHNLAFYLDLIRAAREHIEKGDFAKWKDEMVVKVQRRL